MNDKEFTYAINKIDCAHDDGPCRALVQDLEASLAALVHVIESYDGTLSDDAYLALSNARQLLAQTATPD
jgi:hypothetical protein